MVSTHSIYSVYFAVFDVCYRVCYPQLYYSHSGVAGLQRLYMEVMDPSLEEPQEQPALVDPVKTGKKEDKGKKDRQAGVNGKKGDHLAVLFLLIVPAGVGKRK